jgi:hypothetical protein
MKNAKRNKKATTNKKIVSKAAAKKPIAGKVAAKKDVKKPVAKKIVVAKVAAKKDVKKPIKKKPIKKKEKEIQKTTPKRLVEKEIEKVVVKRAKTETFISLQKELIRQLESSKKIKKTEEQEKSDEKRIKSLNFDLKKQGEENKQTVNKLSSLKKQIKRKNISKQNIKAKLTQIAELEKLVNTKGKSMTTTVDGKQYLHFNTDITKDEISRIKGGDFDYYINDIFNNVLVVRSTEVKGDKFETKVLDFIYAGLLKEKANLENEIKIARAGKDKKKEKALKGSLYGIEKQMEKVYANQDVLDIEDEDEREEALEDAIDETEAPIIIERKNNTIRILG